MNEHDVRRIVRDELRSPTDYDLVIIKKAYVNQLEAVAAAARSMREHRDGRSAHDLYEALHTLDLAGCRYTG